MKIAIYSLFLFIVILILSTCKKDVPPIIQDDNMALRPYVSYSPSTIGSYWIYDRYNVDTSGNATYSQTDSVYIAGDTVINGNTYFIKIGNIFPNMIYYRDSVGYVINHKGTILFSSVNFTDTLHKVDLGNGNWTLSYKMQSGPIEIAVLAGNFTTLNYRGTIVYNIGNSPTGNNHRYINTLYAKGVGLVFETTFYVAVPNHIERRLVRYKIAKGKV